MGPCEENVNRLREAYRLWNESRGASVPQWLELLDEQVVMRSIAGGSPGMDHTQDRMSKAEAVAYFTELAADWEMIHFTPEEFIAQDDRVVVLSRCAWRSLRSGKSVESPKADIFRFRDGRIVEFFEFFDTAKAYAAATPD